MFTLIIPIDFNDYPLEEIDAILHLASKSHVKTSVIFVYTDSQLTVNSSNSLINVDDIIQQRIKSLIHFETKRVEQRYQNLMVTFRTINELSTKQIVYYAKEQSADLIIYIKREKRGGKTINVPKLEVLLGEERDTPILIVPEDCTLNESSQLSFIRNSERRKSDVRTQNVVGEIQSFLNVSLEIQTVTGLSIPLKSEKAMTTIFEISPASFNRNEIVQFFSGINQEAICFI